MKKFVLAALVAAASTTSAHAAVIFSVNASFSSGGTLTGTFTTNDAITQVIAINLISSANGNFQATTYSNVGTIDNQQLPNTFRLTVTSGATKQLQLVFTPALSTSGSTIGGNSFEAQQIIGAGNRSITGTASVQTAPAVPEPATWAMMIGGFTLVGAAMRRRRQTSVVTYA